MAEADLKKAVLIPVPLPVDITDDCTRLLGQICAAGSPIDPRVIRALAFLTDKVDVSGSTIIATIAGTPTVDVTDRCNRQIGTLCSGGVPIDPRIIRNLVFATDKVDVSGSSVTTASGSVATMDDAFMELRLMTDYLKDLPMALDPKTSRVRVNVETGNITNLAQIGSNPANSYIFDIMDIVWNTGIRIDII